MAIIEAMYDVSKTYSIKFDEEKLKSLSDEILSTMSYRTETTTIIEGNSIEMVEEKISESVFSNGLEQYENPRNIHMINKKEFDDEYEFTSDELVYPYLVYLLENCINNPYTAKMCYDGISKEAQEEIFEEFNRKKDADFDLVKLNEYYERARQLMHVELIKDSEKTAGIKSWNSKSLIK